MRIPKRIKIGAKVFQVKWVEDLRGADDEKLFGRCDRSAGVIELSKQVGRRYCGGLQGPRRRNGSATVGAHGHAPEWHRLR